MGQAKQRGTFEQRFAQAKERDSQLLKEQNLALTKPLPTRQVATVGHSTEHSRQRMVVATAMLVAIAGLHSNNR